MKKLGIGFFIALALSACTSSSNSAQPSVSTTAGSPDLEVQDVEEIDDGAKVTLKNIGNAATGEFNIYFELDKDGNTVGEFNKKVSGFAAGEEKVIETSFSGTEYGLGYLKVDSYNTVFESDEENNEFGF